MANKQTKENTIHTQYTYTYTQIYQQTLPLTGLNNCEVNCAYKRYAEDNGINDRASLQEKK